VILQVLKEYYERKPALPRFGWEERRFPFLVVISESGEFLRFEDTREGENGHLYLVPALGEKKGNGIKANLFWENIEYMFGMPMPTAVKPNPDQVRVQKQHEAYCDRIKELKGSGKTFDAINRFARSRVNTERIKKDPLWEKVRRLNTFLLPKVEHIGVITEESEIKDAVIRLSKKTGDGSVLTRACLVTGEMGKIARLEPPIKGVLGKDRKAERSLISFNEESFRSFGKQKNFNAPVGELAVFSYTTALNYLLRSKQRMWVGDASTVFWSAKATKFEGQFKDFFSEPIEDNPDRNTDAIKSLFNAVQNGTLPPMDAHSKFYVLGLAPNAARIAVRFWIVDTVDGMANKICQHFIDTEIVHKPWERDALSLFRMLVSTAVQDKAENIAPNLPGNTMRAILAGLPYPQTLLFAVIRRIRAEHDITYPRAAIIKACINRSTRYMNPKIKEELKVSLDLENTNIGYLLGRLFAVLERAQIVSHTQDGGKVPNSTIRDRYYGAASSTPVAVYGTLLNKLAPHHLSKLKSENLRIYFKKLIAQIMDNGIDGKIGFPAVLSLDNQGRFAIGYYHQMQEFYTKKIQPKEKLS
jgi:CRISPR-associated protein Csd1